MARGKRPRSARNTGRRASAAPSDEQRRPDTGQGAARPGRTRRGPVLWIGAAVVIAAVGWSVAQLWSRGCARTRAVDPGQLNLLLITMDTTRADFLGCFGRESAQTPNIDRLAREGALFSRCVSSAATTLPSHASIMTGLYTFAHGARRNGVSRLSAANLTLAETLKQAGFKTAATVAAFVLNRQFGVDQGFDVYRDVDVSLSQGQIEAERKGDEICNDGLSLLRDLAADRFFLWVHFFDPHMPYETPPGHSKAPAAAYAYEVGFMDRQIGRLLDGLEQLGIASRTLIVVVADHGEGLGGHDEFGHGHFVYDSVVHVPLLFHLPGLVPGGRSVSAQVRSIDISPTVLDLLQLPAWQQVQGVSLWPLMSGEQQDLNLAAYSDTFENPADLGVANLRSLTVGGYKYIHAPRPELYDLARDPGELRNLAAQRPDLVAEMCDRLRTVISEATPMADEGPEAAATSLSAQDRALLEALGYLDAQPVADGRSELEMFEPEGRDPKDFVTDLYKRSMAYKLMKSGRFPEAERLYRQVVERFADSARLHSELATVLLKQGKVAEALARIRRAAAISPDDPEVCRSYGRVLLGARRPEEAVTQLTRAIELAPDDIKTLHDLAFALTTSGRFEEAEGHLERGLELAPRDPSLHNAVGALRLAQGRPDEAERSFLMVLELNPRSEQARAGLRLVAQARQR